MKAFLIALQFLTRLKVANQTEWTVKDFGKSVQTFPLVGMVIGLFMVIVYLILKSFFTPQVLMLVMVAFEFIFTGGLHADGVRDTCDGLFSGRDRERKLEIMKDSRIGSNGVVGFVFLVLLKWQLLVQVNVMPLIIPILFFMPTVTRYTMVMSIKSYPYARKEGMGKAFAEESPSSSLRTATLWLLLPVVVGLIFGCTSWITSSMGLFGAGNFMASMMTMMIIASLLAALLLYVIMLLLAWGINTILNRYITKHLGGTTGDTYGFVTESSEVILLFLLAILHSAFALG